MGGEPAPRVPASRSLLLFQDHLVRGLWAQRHLEALANDPKSLEAFASIVECTRELHKQQQEAAAAQSPAKFKQAATRNKVCMCLSVCHDETMEWLQCVRSQMKLHKGDKEAGLAGQRIHCEERRRQVESCTQYASTRLLYAAVMPQDRNEVF